MFIHYATHRLLNPLLYNQDDGLEITKIKLPANHQGQIASKIHRKCISYDSLSFFSLSSAAFLRIS